MTDKKQTTVSVELTNTSPKSLAVRVIGGHAVIPKGETRNVDIPKDLANDVYFERLAAAGMKTKADMATDQEAAKAEAEKPGLKNGDKSKANATKSEA